MSRLPIGGCWNVSCGPARKAAFEAAGVASTARWFWESAAASSAINTTPEDAFQATFLVLVRKASSIVARETVGNWLYGVAYRTALRARTAAARRRVKEKQMSRPEAPPEDVWRELRPLLDQELNRLPDKYREPVNPVPAWRPHAKKQPKRLRP